MIYGHSFAEWFLLFCALMATLSPIFIVLEIRKKQKHERDNWK